MPVQIWNQVYSVGTYQKLLLNTKFSSFRPLVPLLDPQDSDVNLDPPQALDANADLDLDLNWHNDADLDRQH
jgi:hypothetical protein